MQRVALGREDTRGETVQGIVAVGEEQGLGAARLKSLLGLKALHLDAFQDLLRQVLVAFEVEHDDFVLSLWDLCVKCLLSGLLTLFAGSLSCIVAHQLDFRSLVTMHSLHV